MQETSVGDGAFRTTAWDDLAAARDDPALLGELMMRYWRPVWHAPREEAKDLTQEFFSRLLQDDTFKRADPGRGRFRAFLSEALRHFMLNVRRDASRVKRGGGRILLALDIGEEDDRPIAVANTTDGADVVFTRAWAQQLLADAIDRLRAELVSEGRETQYRVFEAYDLSEQPGTYGDVARALKLRESDVRNYLHEVRGRLQRHLMKHILDYSQDADEAVEEFRALFSREPRP